MIEYLNKMFICRYIEYVNKKSEVSEIDNERLKFSLNTLLNEFEKALALIIIFSLMDKLLPLAVSFITLMSIRMELGGFHCEKNWQCFVITFSFFFLTIMAADNFQMSAAVIITVDVISFISILIFTPIKSKIRNIHDSGIRKKLKIRVLVVMLIIFLLEILVSENYRNYIVWSLVFILVEILLQVISRLRKRCIKSEK